MKLPFQKTELTCPWCHFAAFCLTRIIWYCLVINVVFHDAAKSKTSHSARIECNDIWWNDGGEWRLVFIFVFKNDRANVNSNINYCHSEMLLVMNLTWALFTFNLESHEKHTEKLAQEADFQRSHSTPLTPIWLNPPYFSGPVMLYWETVIILLSGVLYGSPCLS